uniref:Uncharacterized protein n=1 Tax=Chromera velia CCMP2878 TaxID=1169474 RepID=A0A0G4FX89_9ALVE|eukprot:Cvel_19233.t1-p1 / transcript=Cvel_19233.t1 / gene=Cvel_19233 / organism=Chromera_velia_CCMP2878 / gene_product=hypothetical protein / transcript_product=hypothetical protein / location=Cvel_scaffold1644:32271-34937(+) / protein_length=509 / sequence_SO=supercontig / SO=protein_coding / is_pseudo=false
MWVTLRVGVSILVLISFLSFTALLLSTELPGLPRALRPLQKVLVKGGEPNATVFSEEGQDNEETAKDEDKQKQKEEIPQQTVGESPDVNYTTVQESEERNALIQIQKILNAVNTPKDKFGEPTTQTQLSHFHPPENSTLPASNSVAPESPQQMTNMSGQPQELQQKETSELSLGSSIGGIEMFSNPIGPERQNSLDKTLLVLVQGGTGGLLRRVVEDKSLDASLFSILVFNYDLQLGGGGKGGDGNFLQKGERDDIVSLCDDAFEKRNVSCVVVHAKDQMKWWYIKRFISADTHGAYKQLLFLDADAGWASSLTLREWTSEFDRVRRELGKGSNADGDAVGRYAVLFQPVYGDPRSDDKRKFPLALRDKGDTHRATFIECGPFTGVWLAPPDEPVSASSLSPAEETALLFERKRRFSCWHGCIREETTSGYGLDETWCHCTERRCGYPPASACRAIRTTRVFHQNSKEARKNPKFDFPKRVGKEREMYHRSAPADVYSPRPFGNKNRVP